MKNEEALDWLDQFTNNIIQTDIDTRKRTLALQAIMSIKTALKKQIPKKPKDDGWLYCPICNRDVLLDHFTYCPDCGQALDWR